MSNIGPVTMILAIHDPQESSWKVEWVKEVRTKNYGVMQISLETHPTSVADCSRCRSVNHAPHLNDGGREGTALDNFISELVGGKSS